MPAAPSPRSPDPPPPAAAPPRSVWSRHRQTPQSPGGLRRLQIQKYPGYTLSASGLSSNHQEVVLAKQLSLIRSPDALKLCEICGLEGCGIGGGLTKIVGHHELRRRGLVRRTNGGTGVRHGI